MREIPINATVLCSDGEGGTSTSVVVDPSNLTVTHIVVQDISFPPVDRLVPIEQVVETTADSINLNCTKHELANMERFLERHYLSVEEAGEMGAISETHLHDETISVESGYMRVDVEHLPPGRLAVGRGTRVQALDGDVGVVGELLIDPQSGQITHLVLEEGHAFGKVEVTLPLNAIERTEGDTVYLKLNKNAVRALPAVPVTRAWREVHGADIDLLVLAFEGQGLAKEALKTIRGLSREWGFVILNAAVVDKDKKGRSHLKETGDVDTREGAFFGALTGGLIGLIRGPVGAVLGAVAGAGTGGMAARLRDLGFPEERLRALQNMLRPDTSALVTLIEHRWVERVLNRIADLNAEVWRHEIPDEWVERYLEGKINLDTEVKNGSE